MTLGRNPAVTPSAAAATTSTTTIVSTATTTRCVRACPNDKGRRPIAKAWRLSCGLAKSASSSFWDDSSSSYHIKK